MAKEKKELTSFEFNDGVWKKIKKLEDEVLKLKDTLKPAVLAKQASLNDCNRQTRKTERVVTKVNPKRLKEENV